MALPADTLLAVLTLADLTKWGLKPPYLGLCFYHNHGMCTRGDQCSHKHSLLPADERPKMNVPQRRPPSPGPAGGSDAAAVPAKAAGGRSPSPKAKAKAGDNKKESPHKTPSGSPIRARDGTIDWPYVHRCLNWERDGTCDRKDCTFPHRAVNGIRAEMGNLRKKGLTKSEPAPHKAKAPG